HARAVCPPARGRRPAHRAYMPAPPGAEAPAPTSGSFAVSADLATPAGPIRLGTGIAAERPGRRIVHVNQAEAPAVRLGEWLSIGWLTPAMDRLFMEGAGARRRFLDRLVLALDPAHARNAARLDNALRERNRLLGEPAEPDPVWLDAVEAQIAEVGALVATARARLVDRLGAALALLPDSPFARPNLAYQPGGPTARAALAGALAESRRRDRAAQRTLVGPHRDELTVSMAGKDQAAAECSTGEQKAMLIAITLAHAGLLESDRPALLLLDEVAAHLDPVRREALFDRLRGGTAQVWFTGTELAPFSPIAGEAATWRVTGGAVERV
ncbi:MAG: DNA replication and repair protein RecF, partial [Sphingomonadales bacterium]|nr:DNA replication and repair protein RecF [Sphingomonadales bacterium]